MSTSSVSLYEKAGMLYVGSVSGEDVLLIYRYPAGDADVFHWPLDTDYLSETAQLSYIAEVMYDYREMGEIPASTVKAILPSGLEIDF